MDFQLKTDRLAGRVNTFSLKQTEMGAVQIKVGMASKNFRGCFTRNLIVEPPSRIPVSAIEFYMNI